MRICHRRSLLRLCFKTSCLLALIVGPGAITHSRAVTEGAWTRQPSASFALVGATAQAATPPALPSSGPNSKPSTEPVVAPLGTRPRIGLVLSGGGARGLAHVGVLKVLEQAHVPIDMVAGTSMGAIIGGLYASGMTAEQIEAELRKVHWGSIFDARSDRKDMPQRRKDEDADVATAFELGFRDGEFLAPQGTVSSQGLDGLLRRLTLPVQAVRDFSKLPIPFQAVATDMEKGNPVILRRGDLATALRSSMSVPGVFPPTEVDGRVLGDGGLVDNVPVDVARAMGADVVIVVNIGTPLAGRETLNSVIGLTAQMINILTEQNVQRSLATLHDGDVLVEPDLQQLTAGDFERAPEFIQAGENGARALLDRLQALALPEAQYARWQSRHLPPVTQPTVVQFIKFEGTSATQPQRLLSDLQSQVGAPFDPDKAAADTRFYASSGDYVQTDYRLQHTEQGDGLVFRLEDKPWGPNYVNVGLNLSTDLSGNSAFNIKLTHNRHWLTDSGTEWRNYLQIGEASRIYSELYHPMGVLNNLAEDLFVSAWAQGERQNRTIYDANGGVKEGEVLRSTVRVGLDLGQPWNTLGEMRLGLMGQASRNEPVASVGAEERWREAGLRSRIIIDQLDYANFPQHGYRFEWEALAGRRFQDSGSRKLAWVETEGTTAYTWRQQTLALHGAVMASNDSSDLLYNMGRYSLGGFQQLSGYAPGQISGNAMVFGRLNWYMRLSETPVFARGFFVGASVEAGDAWASYHDMRLTGLRYGSSFYLGADTGLGPIYLGLTWAPRGDTGIALMIGRP